MNPDGYFDAELNAFTDAYGVSIVNVHPHSECAGKNCVIHNQSDHSMREFPLKLRVSEFFDIKPQHFERICPHGVGHPDPDDMEYWNSIGEESMGVHGCDGCCHVGVLL